MINDIKTALQVFNALGQAPEILSLKEYLLTIESAQAKFRQENSKLIIKNTKLKEQIKKHNTWEKERKNYEPHPMPSGAIFYRKKNTEELFCPNCYETKMIAVHLQPSRLLFKFCPNCKNEFRISD